MTDHLLLLSPLIVPLAGAAIAAMARRQVVQRLTTAVALVVVLGSGVALTIRSLSVGVVHTAIGVDSPLAGVALTAGPFGAGLVVATGVLVAVVVAAMAAAEVDADPLLHPLVLVLAGGAGGSFVAGDLFNLFVLFEVVLIASYALVARGGEAGQLRGAAVYVGVNLVGTLLLLAGVAAVYGATGTVNLAQLAERSSVGAAMPGAALVVTAFILKAGLLPLSGWLVVGYPAAPATTMALFSGTLTTVGVAALYRVLLLAFHGTPGLRAVVLIAAVATAVLASIAATASDGHGRVLALLVVAQVGFMGMGVGLGTAAAVAAGIFFVLQDIVVKTALVLGHGSLPGHTRLPAAGRGIVTCTFAVLALSMAGIPPLAGFLGKALLVEAALDAGAVTAGAVAAASTLIASLATLAALVVLWRRDVQEPAGLPSTPAHGPTPGRWATVGAAPAATVAVAAVVVGVAPGWLLAIADAGSEMLLDPGAYAATVLGR